jgi:hypothetical protein
MPGVEDLKLFDFDIRIKVLTVLEPVPDPTLVFDVPAAFLYTGDIYKIFVVFKNTSNFERKFIFSL